MCYALHSNSQLICEYQIVEYSLQSIAFSVPVVVNTGVRVCFLCRSIIFLFPSISASLLPHHFLSFLATLSSFLQLLPGDLSSFCHLPHATVCFFLPCLPPWNLPFLLLSAGVPFPLHVPVVSPRQRLCISHLECVTLQFYHLRTYVVVTMHIHITICLYEFIYFVKNYHYTVIGKHVTVDFIMLV